MALVYHRNRAVARCLVNYFYSPLTDKRSDEYSAKALHGRLKLHIEIIKSIRKEAGNNYPIAIWLGACDYNGGGTLQDDIEAAEVFSLSRMLSSFSFLLFFQ